MCMSKPKMPKMKEPKLPPQPLQRQEPAGFQVGRDEDDKGVQKIKANRSRRKLRIRSSDKVSTQTAGSKVGAASGVQTTGG